MVAVAEAFEQVAGLGPATRRDAAVLGEPVQQRVAPRVEQRIRDLGRDRRELLFPGLVGGGVETVPGRAWTPGSRPCSAPHDTESPALSR